MKVNTLFIGAGNFAVEILKALQKSEAINLIAIITQPDKPAGRKKVLTPCPVKDYINQSDLDQIYKIYQPAKVKFEAEAILNEIQPELIIVADYGQILPPSIIDYPKYKCLNVHGSLLPDLRGAVPAPIAILKGYDMTGVSVPIMTPGLDDGAVIAARQEKILSDDTTATLRPRLAIVGGKLLIEVLPKWLNHEIEPVAQDESQATFTWQKDIAKEKAQIGPGMDTGLVERMVRAFHPWPIAWGIFEKNGKSLRVKIIKTDKPLIIETFASKTDGIYKEGKELYLKVGQSCLKIEKLQVEGKSEIEGKMGGFLDGWLLK